jgi:hypothetical protein
MSNTKNASGKKGSLMDVITDSNYGKDTRGEAKGKVYMSNSNNIILPSGHSIDLAARQQATLQAKALQEMTDAYNASLYELDPEYSELELFNGTMLVRLKRQPSTKNGIILSSVVAKPSNANPDAEGEKVENPFPYENVGVVVCSDNDKFNSLDTVQITDKAMNFHWNLVKRDWEWPIAFTKYDDRDGFYGYVLLREYDIQCKFKKRLS